MAKIHKNISYFALARDAAKTSLVRYFFPLFFLFDKDDSIDNIALVILQTSILVAFGAAISAAFFQFSSAFPAAQNVTFADWVALGLAGVAAFTAFQVKLRFRQRLTAERATKIPKAPNPLSLLELLHEHGVRELGSMYLYMPMPKRARHRAAWAWIEPLTTEGLIKGEPWRIEANHIKETIRQSHPHLFEGEPTQFDVYRLDWRAISELMGEELT